MKDPVRPINATAPVRNLLLRSSSRRNPVLLVRGLTLLTVSLSLFLIVCALVPSAWAESLFVTTKLSNTVAVIDFSTDQITTQILVGAGPIRICMSPDRLKAYVSNGSDGTVSVIDTVALTTTATITVGGRPGESAVTPDGGRLFVVDQADSMVTVIDTASNLVITTITIEGTLAKDILFTLDGRCAYIANYSAGTVNIIDTATYRLKTIPRPPAPGASPFLPRAIACLSPIIWTIPCRSSTPEGEG
jgi:YVTN family beta-propeller protein